MSERKINIIGAGLAGLSAAIHLAYQGQPSRLISVQPSERAQSVMAEGGINAALDTMGEGDEPLNHYNDTLKGGVYLADENAVWGLTSHAPEIVEWLCGLGAPFQMKGQRLVLRNFGGQKKKRTAYSRSSTGKILMSALIDEARKYESRGLIHRYDHHRFEELMLSEDADDSCEGVIVTDMHAGVRMHLSGSVILCSGGLNSLFPGMTTGTTPNTGDVTATVFSQGVELANLEFIQYHPTTATIPGKRCLISEAARGEGGRLMVMKDGQPWYFMEERYPELGNLMPRDVVSREMVRVAAEEGCGDQVYLDMTHISDDVWHDKLSDLREECVRLLGTDPAVEYLKVTPGIHFFMGGIYVNARHETNVRDLYAAGECACQYHGANRLGGNSMLGAIYGGKVAAESVIASAPEAGKVKWEHVAERGSMDEPDAESMLLHDYHVCDEAADILRETLGIFRDGSTMADGLNRLENIDDSEYSTNDKKRILMARAMMMSAICRKESRGAHTRVDYPDRNDEHYRRTSVVRYDGSDIHLELRDIAGRDEV